MRRASMEVTLESMVEDEKGRLEKIRDADPAPAVSDRDDVIGWGAAMTTGTVAGFDQVGAPIVRFRHRHFTRSEVAGRSVSKRECRAGAKVVLLLEGGDPGKPIIIGVVQEEGNRKSGVEAAMDGERLILTADREIVLKCGNSSLTLTRAGKVLIQGAYVLSRSSGVNRIKGGSVQIN